MKTFCLVHIFLGTSEFSYATHILTVTSRLISSIIILATRVHEAKSDVCDQPIERGLCLALMHRYAYDKETRECKKFVYGGCGGNKNNFRSLEECRSACVGKSPKKLQTSLEVVNSM